MTDPRAEHAQSLLNEANPQRWEAQAVYAFPADGEWHLCVAYDGLFWLARKETLKVPAGMVQWVPYYGPIAPMDVEKHWNGNMRFAA